MNSSYKDLIVWQRAMELALEVYRCTKAFAGRNLWVGGSNAQGCGVNAEQHRRR